MTVANRDTTLRPPGPPGSPVPGRRDTGNWARARAEATGTAAGAVRLFNVATVTVPSAATARLVSLTCSGTVCQCTIALRQLDWRTATQ